MQLADRRLIKADPAAVWAAILNADVLKECVPGCDSMTGTPETGYEAVVSQKLGPVSARFTGVVTLGDMVEGCQVTLSGEAKGGLAGFAKGGAKVTLTPQNGDTLLHCEVGAKVVRKMAQPGSRIIDGFAKKMPDEFFENFQQVVEGPLDDTDTGEETVAGQEGKRKGWLRRLFTTGS